MCQKQRNEGIQALCGLFLLVFAVFGLWSWLVIPLYNGISSWIEYSSYRPDTQRTFVIQVNYEVPVRDLTNKIGDTDARYNRDGYFESAKDEKGTKEVTFKIFHFDKDVTSYEVTRVVQEAGYRHATLKEFLTFVSAIELRRADFHLLSLGAKAVNSDVVAGFNGSGIFKLYIYTSREKETWDNKFYFLAVAK